MKWAKITIPSWCFVFLAEFLIPMGMRDNHANLLEERLLDQAQVRASYTPPFGGHSHGILQGMIFDVQPFVKSVFCLIRQPPNGFFDSEASIP